MCCDTSLVHSRIRKAGRLPVEPPPAKWRIYFLSKALSDATALFQTQPTKSMPPYNIWDRGCCYQVTFWVSNRCIVSLYALRLSHTQYLHVPYAVVYQHAQPRQTVQPKKGLIPQLHNIRPGVADCGGQLKPFITHRRAGYKHRYHLNSIYRRRHNGIFSL